MRLYHLNVEFSSRLALLAEQSEGKLRTQVSMSLEKFMLVNRLSVALAIEALAIWTLFIVVALVFTITGVDEGTPARAE